MILKWIANLCMGQVMKQIRADLDFAEWRGRTNAENCDDNFGKIQNLQRDAMTVKYAGKPYSVDLLISKFDALEMRVKRFEDHLVPQAPISWEDKPTEKGE